MPASMPRPFTRSTAGDHAAFHAEFFFVIFQRGFRSFPPEPYGIGGALARRDPRKVDWMIFQKFVGAAHHAQKFFLQFPLGKMTAHGALRNVVGRRKIVSRFALVDDKAVTITHAAVQRKFFVVEKRFQIFDQFIRLAGGNFPRRCNRSCVYLRNFPRRKRSRDCAHGNVGAAKGNADGNRFQRRAPRIALFGIVTEHGKIRHVAARGFMPSGTVLHIPISLRAASASRLGVRALSSGVLLPRFSSFLSAMPSPSTTMYFMI